MDTVREFALKVDSRRNPLPYQGIRPGSVACWSDASTELHLQMLSLEEGKNFLFFVFSLGG